MIGFLTRFLAFKCSLWLIFGTAPLAIAGGITSSGASETLEDLNPWFLEPIHEVMPVQYCVEVDEDLFTMSKEEVSEIVDRSVAIWSQVAQLFVIAPVELSGGGSVRTISKKFKRVKNCTETTDLVFKFGVQDEDVAETLQRMPRLTLSFAKPLFDLDFETYNKTGRGRGYIYVANDKGQHSPLRASLGKTRWTVSRLLPLLVHELGHTFGLPHIPGTIMGEEITSYALGSTFWNDEIEKLFASDPFVYMQTQILALSSIVDPGHYEDDPKKKRRFILGKVFDRMKDDEEDPDNAVFAGFKQLFVDESDLGPGDVTTYTQKQSVLMEVSSNGFLDDIKIIYRGKDDKKHVLTLDPGESSSSTGDGYGIASRGISRSKGFYKLSAEDSRTKGIHKFDLLNLDDILIRNSIKYLGHTFFDCGGEDEYGWSGKMIYKDKQTPVRVHLNRSNDGFIITYQLDDRMKSLEIENIMIVDGKFAQIPENLKFK